MLSVIKDVNFSVGCLRGDNFGVLGHVPSFVDFSLVVDLHVNLNARLLRFNNAVTAQSVCIILFFFLMTQDIFLIVTSIF